MVTSPLSILVMGLRNAQCIELSQVEGIARDLVDLRKKSRSGRGNSAWCFIIVEGRGMMSVFIECFKWTRCYVCNMRLRCFCSILFLASSSNDIWGKPHGLTGLASQRMRWNAMDAMDAMDVMDAMARWAMRK